MRLANFDESAVSGFTQDVERDAFHGDATPSAAPPVLSYEPQFGSGYDFNPGTDVTSTPFSPADAGASHNPVLLIRYTPAVSPPGRDDQLVVERNCALQRVRS